MEELGDGYGPKCEKTNWGKQVLFDPLAHDSSLPCLDVVFTLALSTAIVMCD